MSSNKDLSEYIDKNKNIQDIFNELLKETNALRETIKQKNILNEFKYSQIRKEHIMDLESKVKILEEKEKELLAMNKELGKITKEYQFLENELNKKEEKMTQEIQHYIDLFNESLFDEAFILLEQDVSGIDNIIEKNKLIRNFFGFVFSEDLFNNMLEENKLLAVSVTLINNLQKDFLKEMGSKLKNFVDEDMFSVMYSLLLLGSEFDKAKFLLNFFTPSVQTYPKTIEEIINNKNIEGLRFVCENMRDIHYNKDELLVLSCNMGNDALKMLIEEFDFNVNDKLKENSDNLMTALLKKGNAKGFKFIVDNYEKNINWNAQLTNKTTLFQIISTMPTQTRLEYFDILLSSPTLKESLIEKIAVNLFTFTTENYKIMQDGVEHDIYKKLFEHPNFNGQTFTLGQGYFLYELLSTFGTIALENLEDCTKMFAKIINEYLGSKEGQKDIGDSPSYHIVGAILFVANEIEQNAKTTPLIMQLTLDIANNILKTFPQHINRESPNGIFPLTQVKNESPLYNMLVEQGSVTLDPEPDMGFWGGFKNAFSNNKKNPGGINKALIEKAQAFKNTPNGRVSKAKEYVKDNKVQHDSSLSSLKEKIKDELRNMGPLISNPMCDLTIKMKCENMYLTTIQLINMMEKHNVSHAYEEMNFLSVNFSTYIQKTLKFYIQVCNAAVDLAHENIKEDKLNKAKEECIKQIDLLAKQVEKVGESMFKDVEANAKRDFNVQGRFLTTKFSTDGLSEEPLVEIETEVEKEMEIGNQSIPKMRM